jgi:hypothetical protein
MIAPTKDPHLNPLHERPYTPGETWIIGPADPPGAPISGNPNGQSKDVPPQDTERNDDQQHPRP